MKKVYVRSSLVLPILGCLFAYQTDYTAAAASTRESQRSEPGQPSQATLCALHEAGELAGKETGEIRISAPGDESDSESFAEEGYEHVSSSITEPHNLLRMFAAGCDAAFFAGLRKVCSRRQAILTIYETVHKNNVDHTLAYLKTRKQFHYNYYLDVAVSEARKNNDTPFIMQIEPLINAALLQGLEFTQENKEWIYTAKQQLKAEKIAEAKAFLRTLSTHRKNENAALNILRASLPESAQERCEAPSDDESNSLQGLYQKIAKSN